MLTKPEIRKQTTLEEKMADLKQRASEFSTNFTLNSKVMPCSESIIKAESITEASAYKQKKKMIFSDNLMNLKKKEKMPRTSSPSLRDNSPMRAHIIKSISKYYHTDKKKSGRGKSGESNRSKSRSSQKLSYFYLESVSKKSCSNFLDFKD